MGTKNCISLVCDKYYITVFHQNVKNNTYVALLCSDTVHFSYGWTYARRKIDVLFDVTPCCLVDWFL